MASSGTLIVGYLSLFAIVGFLAIFVALLMGRLLRARAPSPEKGEVYECGEPPVGSAFVQFDLRFYVVALLFIVFDVEVAFFFPWATVFGKATQLMDPALSVPAAEAPANPVQQKLEELGLPPAAVAETMAQADFPGRSVEQLGGTLALAAMIDIAVFFAVLMVGFAYVWYRGDLNWVRAVGDASPLAQPSERPVAASSPPTKAAG